MATKAYLAYYSDVYAIRVQPGKEKVSMWVEMAAEEEAKGNLAKAQHYRAKGVGLAVLLIKNKDGCPEKKYVPIAVLRRYMKENGLDDVNFDATVKFMSSRKIGLLHLTSHMLDDISPEDILGGYRDSKRGLVMLYCAPYKHWLGEHAGR